MMISGQDLTIQDFWGHLAGNDRVQFNGCNIEGDGRISEAEVEFESENGDFLVTAEIICDDCTFTGGITFNNTSFKRRISFRGTQFQGNVVFSRIKFKNDVSFENAKFHRETRFSRVKLQNADFDSTEFREDNLITFEECKFNGNSSFIGTKFHNGATVTFSQETTFCQANFTDTEFRGRVSFRTVIFQDQAVFQGTQFRCGVHFDTSVFQKEAAFNRAIFAADASFIGTMFQEKATFIEAKFGETIDFHSAIFAKPSDFEKVDYKKNTVGEWLRLRIKKQPTIYTKIRLDSAKIDEVTNPLFKRYVADLQYIEGFKKEHPLLAPIWQCSSDYGRSFGLWAFWSVVLIVFYALIYGQYDWKWWGIPLFGGTFWITVAYIWNVMKAEITDEWRMVLENVGGKIRSDDAPKLKEMEEAERKVKNHIKQELVRDDFRHYITFILPIGSVSVFIWLITWLMQELDFKVMGNSVFVWKIRWLIQGLDFTVMKAVSPNIMEHLISHLHFSLTTFTTLGFNYDASLGAREKIWLMTEVILGYVMLGGLISIFANKLARRS